MDTRPVFPLNGLRIFMIGRKGMVGAAVLRRLARESCTVLTADRATLDLTLQQKTHEYLAAVRPDVVVVAAAEAAGMKRVS